MESQQRLLSLSDKLDILSRSHNGETNMSISESVGCTKDTVHQILTQRSRITKCSSPRLARRYLQLGDKLKVILLAETGTTRQQILDECSISPRTFRRIVHKKEVLQSHAKKGRPLTIMKELYGRYPEVDTEVEAFVSYARSLGLPVTRELMQERALPAAVTRGITTFKASNGYIEKFMKRAGIDSSVRLHGRGVSTIPSGHEERMNQIHDTCSLYPLRNICNMDESGLFYRLCPRMSYLSSSEIRLDVRGTDLQRNKNRITIVMAVNADGLHILPVWYIGHTNNPKCFRDSRYTALKSFYSNQTNVWMDSKEYTTWLQWWFGEVRKVTQEDILLIMHNCGSHEEGINLSGLRVDFLPPKSTHKY